MRRVSHTRLPATPPGTLTAPGAGSGEVVVEGEAGGGGAVVHAELAVDVGDVRLDGARAEEEPRGDGGVAQPRGEQPQHLRLARREAGGARRGGGRGAGGEAGGEALRPV